MDGDAKFMVDVYCLFAICFTILYCVLFYALWDYKEYVGFSLLGLLILFVVSYIRGRYVEQELRRMRYQHKEETPLDAIGEPVHWHMDAQINPHRTNEYQQQSLYQGYRQE